MFWNLQIGHFHDLYTILGFSLLLGSVFFFIAAWLRPSPETESKKPSPENRPNIIVTNANARYDEVRNQNNNILTLALEFKNIGKSRGVELVAQWASAVEPSLDRITKDKPQTTVNPINPDESLTLPLRFSIPVQLVEHGGKQERAMKPEQLFIYVAVTYKSQIEKEALFCEEFWFKHRIGDFKANHQTLEDKARFEPFIRQAGFDPCSS